jgi:hypothetical protein
MPRQILLFPQQAQPTDRLHIHPDVLHLFEPEDECLQTQGNV